MFVGEEMLQSRAGTGWKRPSERLEETEDRLADRRKHLTQSITVSVSHFFRDNLQLTQ